MGVGMYDISVEKCKKRPLNSWNKKKSDYILLWYFFVNNSVPLSHFCERFNVYTYFFDQWKVLCKL